MNKLTIPDEARMPLPLENLLLHRPLGVQSRPRAVDLQTRVDDACWAHHRVRVSQARELQLLLYVRGLLPVGALSKVALDLDGLAYSPGEHVHRAAGIAKVEEYLAHEIEGDAVLDDELGDHDVPVFPGCEDD